MKRKRNGGFSLTAIIILMLAAAVASGTTVYLWQNPGLFNNKTAVTENQESKTLRETVLARADNVLHTLKNNDMSKLAEYVHPDKGLRFSPYSNMSEKDITIPAAKLSEAAKDKSKLIWGAYDGSGDAIDLTFNEYFNKFIYPKDYLEAPEIILNQAVQRGNSKNNIKETFPDAYNIEYYFSGFEKQYEGMDWRSLTLVFEQKNDIWYLVGLVNNQWTI